MLFLGFSAGLPFALIFGTLSLWLNEAGIDKSTNTFFSWALLGYSFKFIWAPLVDRLPLPLLTGLLGRRRSWLLFSQLCVIAAIFCMGSVNPAAGDTQLAMIAMGAVLLGFSAATQDIVIDAYRIETADVTFQPMMASIYMGGYRIGMIVAGAGALYLASYFGSSMSEYSYSAWSKTYYLMAALAVVGVVTTLVIKEPQSKLDQNGFTNIDYVRFFGLFVVAVAVFVLAFRGSFDLAENYTLALSESWNNRALASVFIESARLLIAGASAALVAWLLLKLGFANKVLVRSAYVEPVTDFFNRYSVKSVLILLALVGFYRISDIVLGVVANLFYQDIGYTKIEIADASKVFGLIMTILGGLLAGVLALRLGVMRLLFIGALLSAITNVLYIVLAEIGYTPWMLYVVIAADNLSGGLALAAFIAFLSSLTSISFTAVQYAIFSSLMTLLPKIIGGYSGTIVDAVGYPSFFLLTALMGLPVLLLVWLANKHLYSKDNPQSLSAT